MVTPVKALQPHMDMDTAAPLRAALHARVPKLTEQFQEHLKVFILQNRGDQLTPLIIRAVDTAVPLELPLAALGVPGAPGAVSVHIRGIFVVIGSEEPGSHLGGILPGDIVSLDLYSKGLRFDARNKILHVFALTFYNGSVCIFIIQH
jgi:hypothetical protein